MLSDSALQAFSMTAGLPASHLSLLTRTALLGCFLVWASWCALALLIYHRNRYSEPVVRLLIQYVQLFFLVGVVSALVFVSP
jgi:hypothetical protein